LSQNTDLIDRFTAAWKRLNVDEIMGFFSDDAVYTNIPIDPPNQGKEAIRKTIEGFVGMATAIEFVIHRTAENPAAGLVMNERTDRFRIGEKWVEARVMGVFEIRGGKIAAWRDYFDLAEFQSQMSAS
jgi:limonene-1,2-epoxide hydrolase